MPNSLSRAISTCEHTVKTYDADPEAFLSACQKLGYVLQSQGLFEEASMWHSQSLALGDLNLGAVYANLGRLYVKQQLWQPAAEAYQRAITEDSSVPSFYWELAQIFIRLERTEDKLECWYQAVRLEPNRVTAEGYCSLGDAFLGCGNQDRATACYERAIKMDSDYAPAYQKMGALLQENGNYEQSRDCYQQAIDRNQNWAWPYYELGNLLYQQKQFGDAEQAFRRSLEHDTPPLWARHNLGETLLRQGKWEEAIAVSEETLDTDSSQSWAYSHSGTAFIELGRKEEAIVCYQKAAASRGWQMCLERKYQFTQDWFTHNIPVWEKYITPLRQDSELHYLEIGSFQGMSACWLLDNMLHHSADEVVCVDPNFQPEFDINIAKTKSAATLTKHVGSSHDVLPKLKVNHFNLIYIDGCHLADVVEKDGHLAWPLLKPQGILIFDDYEWFDLNFPGQDPKIGIDAFICAHQDQLTLLHKGYQVIVQKSSNP